MQPETLAQRARTIRLSRREIAARARVNPNTVSRTLNGGTDPRYGTHTSIEGAIAAEEIALRDHLMALHPVKAVAA